MRTVKVEFIVEVDDYFNEEEINEWIKYSLGETARISLKNDLHDFDIEAKFGSVAIEIR